MKLSKWCQQQGVCYLTGLRWFHAGKIPNARQLDTSTILVDEVKTTQNNELNYIYCRVSNHNRKKELEHQVKRCEDFCIANGWKIEKTYKEIASGMNDNRKELWKLLASNPKRIIVENKDRLTRFGFNYIEKLMPNTEIIIINKSVEDKEDLIKDLISVITIFCNNLYELKEKNNKLKKIKEVLNDKNL
jgi:predicted site-specific integrase-resolvase